MSLRRSRPGIRSKIPYGISSVAVAAGVGIPWAEDVHGAALWALRGTALVCALCAPLALAVKDRQTESDQHLDVGLEATPATISSLPTADAFLTPWVERRRARCLASLAQAEPPYVDFDALGPTFGAGRVDFGIRDLVELERRQQLGEPLADSERAHLEAVQRRFAKSVQNAVAGWDIFSTPDRRTPEQYRSEVADHLRAAEHAARIRMVQEFLRHQQGRIRPLLSNPTDKPYADVVVELFVPTGVAVQLDVPEVDDLATVPSSPLPFGQRRSTLATGPREADLSRLGTLGLHPLNPPPAKPKVAKTESGTKVTFPPVSLRPESKVHLEAVHLVPHPGQGQLALAWEATAANARLRLRGHLPLSIGEGPSAEELIGAILLDPTAEDPNR